VRRVTDHHVSEVFVPRSSANRSSAGGSESDPKKAGAPDTSDEVAALDTGDEVAADEVTSDDVDADAEAADDDADVSDGDDVDDGDDADPGEEAEVKRTKQADTFWAKSRIDPIEVALPDGVGYTLRAYRMNTEIVASDYTLREEHGFPDRSSSYVTESDELDEDDFDDEDLLDEDEDVAAEEAEADAESGEDDDESEDDEDADAESEDEDAEDDDADDDEDSDADEDAEDESEAARGGKAGKRRGKAAAEEEPDESDFEDEAPEEEVPLFLSQGGRLLLFRTRAGLLEFLRSDAEHDLSQLADWSSFVDDVRPAYVVATEDDTYELDLVVKNLRAGHDAWDPDLVLRAGQLARDLGHALRIEPIVMAMAPGSPLDDLDEALRSLAAGGLGTFFARRKAKKIGTETASIGWRTVIGKISAVVDWRD
jgi:hypothetical protein